VRYVAVNTEAARIIMADSSRYGGAQAGVVLWERLVLDRAVLSDADAGPLFASQMATGGTR
jgi:hypothetical protein